MSMAFDHEIIESLWKAAGTVTHPLDEATAYTVAVLPLVVHACNAQDASVLYI